jgi:hypothetical protein
MTASAGSDALKHIHEADQITGDIFIRIGQRAAYPGLRGQMYDRFKITATEDALYALPVGNVQREEPETGPHAEFPQARIF